MTDVTDQTRDVPTVTTRLLRTIMASRATSSRTEADTARAALHLFLSAFAVNVGLSTSAIQDMADASLGPCQENAEDGWCCHMLPSLPLMTEKVSHEARLANMLCYCCKIGLVCPCVRAFACCLLERISSIIDSSTGGMSSNPLKQEHDVPEGGKRRKISEAFKEAVINRTDGCKKHMLTSRSVVTNDGISAKRHRTWCLDTGAAYAAAVKRAFDGVGGIPGVIGLSFDGFRIGNPGEERNSYIAVRHSRKCAGYLRSQVGGAACSAILRFS